MEETSVDILNFRNEPVRMVVREDGEPWWIAKDVCECLGIKNPTQAVNQLDDDERAMFNIGRQGGANVINEPGVYSLIFRSRKEQAKLFKRWLAHEVIPQIRRTGRYVAPGLGGEAGTLQAQIDELRAALAKQPQLPLTTDAAPLVLAFWEVVDQLPRGLIDHGLHPNELAVNLPHFHEVAAGRNLPPLPPQPLKYVLRHCSTYLRQAKVHSQIWHRTAHCWVFHLPHVCGNYNDGGPER